MPFFGSTVNLGSSDSATFIRKVALSHFQPCIRAGDVGIDRAARHQAVEQQLRIDPGDDDFRPPRLAARDHARGAAVASTITSSTGVLRRMSTPASRHARAIAWVIEPMPPIAWPQAPGTPAASPNKWWSRT